MLVVIYLLGGQEGDDSLPSLPEKVFNTPHVKEGISDRTKLWENAAQQDKSKYFSCSFNILKNSAVF